MTDKCVLPVSPCINVKGVILFAYVNLQMRHSVRECHVSGDCFVNLSICFLRHSAVSQGIFNDLLSDQRFFHLLAGYFADSTPKATVDMARRVGSLTT